MSREHMALEGTLTALHRDLKDRTEWLEMTEDLCPLRTAQTITLCESMGPATYFKRSRNPVKLHNLKM